MKNALTRWEKFLCAKRFRPSRSKNVPQDWNPFDSDYSRIVFSAAFRRLQDKAQVYPLDNNDFVRTRLTHSIEVSSVARSIGVRIENWLIGKKYLPSDKKGHIPSILAAAGIAHDIGNPPFGHFGEERIQDFFKKNELIQIFFDKNSFSDAERQDFTKFDGNVQSLRLLLRLGLTHDEYSLNLTCPTLATIIKYPYDSTSGNKTEDERKSKNLGVSYKKFGYFQSERDIFNDIDKTLGLENRRHPLCFALEASDDICYSSSDIEDGFAKKTIGADDLLDELNRFKDKTTKGLVKLIKERTVAYKDHPKKLSLIAQDCRIYAHGKMIEATIDSFKANHNKILNGNFDAELLTESRANNLRSVFSTIAKKSFASNIVIKRELVGATVLDFLLEYFSDCLIKDEFVDSKSTKNYCGKKYHVFSNYFKHVMRNQNYNNEPYKRMQLLTDYISGMTDTFAIDTYNSLLGINL